MRGDTLCRTLFSGLLLLSSAVQANNMELASQVQALWQANDYAAAKALLAPLVSKQSKDAQLLALLGRTEAGLQQMERAEALLEKAVKYDANNADYQHWYATASCNLASSASMFSALGYAKRCKKAYETALKLAPENPRSYIALGSFLAQAPGIAGGDKDKAQALAQQLKQLDEVQGWLLHLRLTEFSDDEAFKQFLAEAKPLQQRPEAYFQRAMQLTAQESYPAAIALLQQAIQQPAVDDDAKASIAESHYQLARCAVLGKTAISEGIAAMQHYLQHAPKADRLDWAKFRLAQLYLLSDQTDKAKALTQPLLASTNDDKLKAELKKIL
ncbi:tetratricopeptide repeat protein [Rheinheimera fenheensis]|uniref:tetratricopeptide repeat protein n=1 Tax=Rheinheimera fenheensis TaxID=3152295 RepID=UPI003260BD28